MPFLFARWRHEYAANLENGDTLGSSTNISFEHFEQTADQAWPQRDMILGQRVAQLERFTRGHGVSRNQF